MEQKTITASGIELPMSDVKDIQKRTAKETLRNAFAVIGVVSVGLFVKGYLDNKGSSVTPPVEN